MLAVCLLSSFLKAVMKSFVASTSDSSKPDKFLAYMVPSVGELSKDIYDESEDISYMWVHKYHWDVRGEDADDPTSFLVSFGESEARYMGTLNLCHLSRLLGQFSYLVANSICFYAYNSRLKPTC